MTRCLIEVVDFHKTEVTELSDAKGMNQIMNHSDLI